MGNSKSSQVITLTSGLKRLQEDKDAQQLYRLVDLHGGGELLTWVKYAMSSGDSSIFEGVLDMKVKKYMYNDGKGKLIPVAELVKIRNQDRNDMLSTFKRKKGKGKSGLNILEDINQDTMQGDMMKALKFLDGGGGKGGKGNSKYRDICWYVNQRGAMGENILHSCLVNGTAVHNELARRLIIHFPKLINDIFLSENYYGYSALHQAIINENPEMVRFLLQHGADVNMRCYGAFYCPDDQRGSRVDSLEHEWVDLNQRANYTGRTYYGEYPLAFAACSNQPDCFRLLRAKKADPNLRDTNGNTILHLMVIHELPHMFDLAYKLGGKLHITNNQNLTPLTLAAKLAKKRMFAHILTIEREIQWTYGGVLCAAYPLAYIDTINQQNGELNHDSALHLIIHGDTTEHLDLIDGMVEDLLLQKWEAFAKKKLFYRLAVFVAYLTIFFVGFYFRRFNMDVDETCGQTSYITNTNNTTSLNDDGVANTEIGPIDWFVSQTCWIFQNSSYLWDQNYTINSRNCSEFEDRWCDKVFKCKPCAEMEFSIRWFCEIALVIAVLLQIANEAIEIKRLKWASYMIKARNFPAEFIYKLSFVGVLLMTVFRVAEFPYIEHMIGLIVILATSANFFFFCRGIRFVGPFILMVYKIVGGDMFRFFLIYLIFVFGFSQSFFIIFLDGCSKNATDNSLVKVNILESPFESIVRMFIMSIGEFTIFYKHLYHCPLGDFGKVLFIIFELCVSIMLINLLIAMMARTYQRIAETEKEWKRQWAKVILMLEQSLNPVDRLMALLKYSRPIGTNKSNRAIIVKWQQTEKEEEEYQENRIERWRIFREEKKFLLRRRLLGEMVDLENFSHSRDRRLSKY